LPQSRRAIPECPVKEFRKSGVSALLSRARSNHIKTEATIGTPGNDWFYAVKPSERNRPRRRPTRERRPLLFEIKHDQYLRHGFDSRPYLFRQAQYEPPIVMRALDVEPYPIKQLARQQIAGGLDETRSPEQRAPIEKILIEGSGIVIDHPWPDIRRRRRHYSTETAYKRRGPIGRKSDLSFQLVWQPLIVIVKKRDPFARCVIDAGVACTSGGQRVWI
jgi:hypothetical protein